MDAEAMGLYGEQRFSDVLDLLNREGDAYPDRAWYVLYLRSCMAARVGEPEMALRTLRDALDRGYWYGQEMVRQSPSWQSLQGVPEFERIAEICMAREAEALANSAPRLFTVEPEGGCTGEGACPLFIALHGNGDNGRRALEGWRPAASEGRLLAAPQSSQITGYEAFVWDDQEKALLELAAHYSALSAEYAVDEKRVVVAGFSMGGDTALRAALQGTVPAKGFVLLGPGGPTIDHPQAALPLIQAAKSRELRGYILLGENDDDVLHAEIRTLVQMLNENGIPCELEMLPNVRHQYPRDPAPSIRRALVFVG
jgi:dienelactone hydrolase